MKLYDQTLKEIFQKIPIMYKMVIIAGCGFLLFTFSFILYNLYAKTVKMTSPYFIEMENAPKNILSMFDPSISEDPANFLVGMAFAAQTEDNISIRLAVANPKCEKWTFLKHGIEGKKDILIAPDGISEFRDGIWRVETPSLVYDPDDKGKEWKLFAYKYFWSPKDPINAAIKIAKYYGIITYKYTSDLFNGDWSDEKWLFSPAPGSPPPPYQSLIGFHLNSLSPELANVTSYSRPSVIYHNGMLFMALSAFTNKTTPDRLILLTSADHGQNWKYLGSPIVESDAKYIEDSTNFKGANLIKFKGEVYLAAVFGNEESDTGTTILKFKDINKAEIKRTPVENSPVVENSFKRFSKKTKVSNGGFIGYSDACQKPGIVVSEQNSETGQFKLIQTFEDPL